MTPGIRLLISAMTAFIANFGWAFWANSMVTDNTLELLRVALVQGTYSSLVTAGFTYALEWTIVKMRQQDWPIAWVAPLPPLVVQSSAVILLNVLNQTPNLWLTVAPSIIFSCSYGYIYTLALLRSGKD